MLPVAGPTSRPGWSEGPGPRPHLASLSSLRASRDFISISLKPKRLNVVFYVFIDRAFIPLCVVYTVLFFLPIFLMGFQNIYVTRFFVSSSLMDFTGCMMQISSLWFSGPSVSLVNFGKWWLPIDLDVSQVIFCCFECYRLFGKKSFLSWQVALEHLSKSY